MFDCTNEREEKVAMYVVIIIFEKLSPMVAIKQRPSIDVDAIYEITIRISIFLLCKCGIWNNKGLSSHTLNVKPIKKKKKKTPTKHHFYLKYC